MDLRWPNTTIEAQALSGIVHYYRDMLPRQSHTLAPMIEVASFPKGRIILWNDAQEDSFMEIKQMVSAETVSSYPDWTITFTLHTNDSDKQLADVISQNSKPIELFSRILIHP